MNTQLVSAATLLAQDPPILDEVIPGLLSGTVGLLSGADGVSKSLFAMALCWSVAGGGRIDPGLGAELIPKRPPQLPPDAPLPLGQSVMVCGEDPAEVLAHRVHRIARELTERGVDQELVEDLAGYIHLAPLDGTGSIWSAAGQDGGGPTAGGERVVETVRAMGEDGPPVRLVVIDTLAALADLEEISQREMTAFVRWCRSIAQQIGCAVLIVHHEGQGSRHSADAGTAAARGATALPAACRWVARIRRLNRAEAEDRGLDPDAEGGDWIQFQLVKRNYVAGGCRGWWLNWKGGALPELADLPPLVREREKQRRCGTAAASVLARGWHREF